MAEFQQCEAKEIDTDQVVRYLNHAFSKATQGMGKSVRQKNQDGKYETTQLYDLQVEYSYLVNEIQRGPKYIVPKLIAEANSLIERIASMEKAA